MPENLDIKFLKAYSCGWLTLDRSYKIGNIMNYNSKSENKVIKRKRLVPRRYRRITAKEQGVSEGFKSSIPQSLIKNLINNQTQDLPELNQFISDLEPLLKSTDLLVKSSANMNKKDWGWGDLLLFVLASANFGLRAYKTTDDFTKLVEAVKNPKPAPTPMDARLFFQLQVPAFALLNNQKLGVDNW